MTTYTMQRYRRYSGNDAHLGPYITWSKHSDEGWRPVGIVLSSGDSDHPGCHLVLSAMGRSLILELPQLIKPWVGPEGCWDRGPHEREFGFRFSGEGFLQVYLGPQTHDSVTTKSWGCFLPWMQWRHVRQSWYGPTGQHIETLWDTTSRTVRQAQWEWRQEFLQSLVKTKFLIKDYDGEEIVVSTHIGEREWRFGTKWCSWLSIFRKPRIRRSLDIEFGKECGPDKGSWKGGLIGTGIEMLPGELHEDAFRRYCEQEHSSKHGRYRITYLGKIN